MLIVRSRLLTIVPCFMRWDENPSAQKPGSARGGAKRTAAFYLHPAIVWEREGVTPSRGQGAEPLGHSRAFSDMRGERAPAMTRRGKRVSAERKECSGSPGESIFGGVKSRRFIAGVAEMNAWRRSVRAAGYCRA